MLRDNSNVAVSIHKLNWFGFALAQVNYGSSSTSYE